MTDAVYERFENIGSASSSSTTFTVTCNIALQTVIVISKKFQAVIMLILI